MAAVVDLINEFIVKEFEYEQTVNFYINAFGAQLLASTFMNGLSCARLALGNSQLQIRETKSSEQLSKPRTLIISTADPNQLYQQAIDNGCTSLTPLTPLSIGVTSLQVTDIFGVTWQFLNSDEDFEGDESFSVCLVDNSREQLEEYYDFFVGHHGFPSISRLQSDDNLYSVVDRYANENPAPFNVLVISMETFSFNYVLVEKLRDLDFRGLIVGLSGKEIPGSMEETFFRTGGDIIRRNPRRPEDVNDILTRALWKLKRGTPSSPVDG